jgi:hypothetical protein
MDHHGRQLGLSTVVMSSQELGRVVAEGEVVHA